MIVLHWLQAPIRGADALGLLGLWVFWHVRLTRGLVKAEWQHAKARLGAELEQLKQRHNLAKLAAQQAEDQARGR